MATLNGYKTSGTFSGTTTFQNLVNAIAGGMRGIITVTAGAPNYSMIAAFFEYSETYCSLTQIAASGNTNQLALNTSNAASAGTQNVFIQQYPINTGTYKLKFLHLVLVIGMYRICKNNINEINMI